MVNGIYEYFRKTKGRYALFSMGTGSGKTMTSYKATRNLLMDIPSIEKTIFLIDRKDLDTQTKMAFQSYADHDLIDVDETENVTDLVNKLSNDRRLRNWQVRCAIELYKKMGTTNVQSYSENGLSVTYMTGLLSSELLNELSPPKAGVIR